MTPEVLLVEDEPEARASLSRALRREGFACREASDTASGMTIAKDEPVDLAILDLVLGDDERGGLSVLAALRARHEAPPAILITAFADVERLKEALNLGASYLLEKPFRAADLIAVCRKLLADKHDLTGLVASALERAGLTEREAQIARLVLKGLPSAEIAVVLGSSDKTVRQHITRIYEKCRVTSRPEFFHYVFPF
jgi:DNA-binding NarL/FixJ family response regulator